MKQLKIEDQQFQGHASAYTIQRPNVLAPLICYSKQNNELSGLKFIKHQIYGYRIKPYKEYGEHNVYIWILTNEDIIGIINGKGVEPKNGYMRINEDEFSQYFYTENQWLALERDRKIDDLLND